MAKIALIKLFLGLNLGVSQLSAELQRTGHDSLIIYFKKHIGCAASNPNAYPTTDYSGIVFDAMGNQSIWKAYLPFTEKEYELLFQTLNDFNPDLIGFSVTSSHIKETAQVTSRIKVNPRKLWCFPLMGITSKIFRNSIFLLPTLNQS